MRLAAIYNSWDDWDMLQHSIRNMRPLVDMVIVVYSYQSNYGENRSGLDGTVNDLGGGIYFHDYRVDLSKRPEENERAKRNYGLQLAKDAKATHFLMADSDEVYEPEPFLKEKERFLNPNLNGLVCASQVYFKSPKLTIGLDITLVPFIHKLTPQIQCSFNKKYPFAWDGPIIRIDPTRSYNINLGVEWSNIIMHHYSWVRYDYEKKIRNSTARANIERSSIRKDLLLAKENYYVKFYGKTLIRASVNFNIPEFDVHEDIQPLATSRNEKPGDD